MSAQHGQQYYNYYKTKSRHDVNELPDLSLTSKSLENVFSYYEKMRRDEWLIVI